MGRGALRRAVVEGDTQNSSLMAGQIAGLINKEESCQEILQSYMDVCQATIREKASEWL